MAQGRISEEDITEKLVGDRLDTHGLPEPDLLIRTCTEQRVSNNAARHCFSLQFPVPQSWPWYLHPNQFYLQGCARCNEQRVSNFLQWQLAYTELYFTPVSWPDFSKEELEKAVEAYNKRDRKFGLVFSRLVNKGKHYRCIYKAKKSCHHLVRMIKGKGKYIECMFFTRLFSSVILVIIALVTLLQGGYLLAAVLLAISLIAYRELR